ncbi:MAG: hypothetical protein ACR2OU_01040 [Thermomicrobiales bacterium]
MGTGTAVGASCAATLASMFSAVRVCVGLVFGVPPHALHTASTHIEPTIIMFW